MNKRNLLILEIIWIAVGFICLYAGIRSVIIAGISKAFIFFIMALISFAFAWARDHQRKKH